MDKLLLIINVLACALISLRIIFYTPPPNRHYKPLISWLAYFIAVATGWIVIRTIFGDYKDPDIAETLLNILFCLAIFSVRGNVSALVKKIRGAQYDH